MKIKRYLLPSLIFSSLLLCSFIFQASKESPSGGKCEKPHYSKLASLSAKARPDYKALDDIHWKVPEGRTVILFKQYYLPLDTTQFHISDPPANSSIQTRAELNYILKLQKKRSGADVQRILEIERNQFTTGNIENQTPEYRRPLFYIGRSIEGYTPENFPLTSLLLAKTEVEINWYINTYKQRFKRTRPWALDTAIKSVFIPPAPTPSYPSGHAAFAFSQAFILMKLAPEFKELFLKDAIDFAWSREQGGIHYPSDTRASRKFCEEYVKKVFESGAFRNDFENAKTEWREAIKKGIKVK